MFILSRVTGVGLESIPDCTGHMARDTQDSMPVHNRENTNYMKSENPISLINVFVGGNLRDT